MLLLPPPPSGDALWMEGGVFGGGWLGVQATWLFVRVLDVNADLPTNPSG